MFRFYRTFTRLVACLLLIEMSSAKRNTSYDAVLFLRIPIKIARFLYFIESDKKYGNKQMILPSVCISSINVHSFTFLGKLNWRHCKLTTRSDWQCKWSERFQHQENERYSHKRHKRSVPKDISWKTVFQTQTCLLGMHSNCSVFLWRFGSKMLIPEVIAAKKKSCPQPRHLNYIQSRNQDRNAAQRSTMKRQSASRKCGAAY